MRSRSGLFMLVLLVLSAWTDYLPARTGLDNAPPPSTTSRKPFSPLALQYRAEIQEKIELPGTSSSVLPAVAPPGPEADRDLVTLPTLYPLPTLCTSHRCYRLMSLRW